MRFFQPSSHASRKTIHHIQSATLVGGTHHVPKPARRTPFIRAVEQRQRQQRTFSLTRTLKQTAMTISHWEDSKSQTTLDFSLGLATLTVASTTRCAFATLKLALIQWTQLPTRRLVALHGARMTTGCFMWHPMNKCARGKCGVTKLALRLLMT